ETMSVLLNKVIGLLKSAEATETARQNLDELRSQIDPDSGNADLVLAEIGYLYAYSFIIDNNLAEAAKQYQQLITTYPDSYWSLLAELQLP
ncbi:MAG: tetratricopeptide repeat protein, partial [Candidatus Promineifilaceae bacterium]